MKKRIFVAINLPEKIKKQLKAWQEKYDYLPVRWTKEDSLHLTLVFIGYVSDEQMIEACRVGREIAGKTGPFSINFKKIVLAPPGKPPRMIWLEGEASRELADLKNKLEDALLGCNSGLSRKEPKAMRPHITLARIRTDQWRQMESTPKIDEDFSIQLPVNSIEAMESDLKYDGAEYVVLENCSLAA